MMAKGYEVLEMLIPTGGWVITGDDFDGIEFIEATPITKKQFEDGFALVDDWKAKTSAKAAADKAALLEKLGITEDEARLLLG
jgi:hypothetical protein